MKSIALAFWIVQGLGGWSVHGVVRWSDTERPIAGALVEVVGTDRRTRADVEGAYAIADLACTSCRLRFSAPLSDTAVVEVNAGPDSVVRIDVALSPRPGRLPAITVVGRTGDNDAATAGGPPPPSEPSVLGARRYTAGDIEASPIGNDADPLRIMTSAADVASLPDIGTSLHVRGGSADQNLVLLDGIPVYSAYHASGVLSAVSPDFVDAVTLDAGVQSARHGNALSSTIAIDTRRSTNATVAHGGANPFAVRQSVAGPLPGGVGGFVVTARQSTRALAFGQMGQATSGAFGDAAAKVTIGLPLGSLELLGFGTRDRVGFDGRVTVDTAVGGQNAGGPGSSPSLSPQDVFSWSNATEGAVWSLAAHGGPALTVRGWHSAADARLAWAAASGPIRLASGLQDMGGAGEATWRTGWGQVSTGASVDRLATNYHVFGTAPSSTTGGLGGPHVHLQADPLLAAAFLEARWQAGRRLSLITGMREEIVPGLTSTLEPRVSIRYALTPELTVAGGFARTQQIVQSLRNEESILDAVVGVGLPVAVGAGGVPLARADQLTAALEQRLGQRTTVTLDGYVRRMDGLLGVASVTAQPFAVDRLGSGTGTASGLALQLRHRADRLDVQAAYGLNVAARNASGQRYVPSFDAQNTVVAALGYRLGSGTTLRGSLWATSERHTSLIGDAFEWTPYAPAGGAGELAGSPQHLIGPLDGRRLPSYVRVDLGVTQIWRPTLLGRAARLTGRVGVTNVLNHANILGILLAPGATGVQRLPLLPRSLAFSIEWAY